MTKWLALFIGGQKWSVYLVSPKSKYLKKTDGGYDVGKCVYDKCAIYVSKGLAAGLREDVLWHELLHALTYVTGAEMAYDGDHDRDEMLVSRLAPTMHRLLRDLGMKFPVV